MGTLRCFLGAFSAYRYIALQNDSSGKGPLQNYFLGETMHGADADIFMANMYLAEDRIQLFSKRGCSLILHYVKSAYAETDVPDQVPELISQSSHTFLRKFWIHLEMLYLISNLIFSWFALVCLFVRSFLLLKHFPGHLLCHSL